MLVSAALNVGILLRALGQRPPWGATLWVVHLSRSFGAVLPGRLGDLTLPPILNRRGVPLSTGTAVLALNKGVSFVVVVLAAGAAFYFLLADVRLAVRVLGAGAAVGAVSLAVLWAMRHVPALRSVARQLVHVPRRAPLSLLAAIGVTTAALGLIAAAIGEPVGGDVLLPWHMVLGIHAIGMMASQIPVSIGGVGVREAVVVSLFARIGADPARVAAAYLAMTAISIVVGGVTLLVRLARRRRAEETAS